jgi:hypothetical protein
VPLFLNRKNNLFKNKKMGMKNRIVHFFFVIFLAGLTFSFMNPKPDGNQVKVEKTSAQDYLAKIRNNQITGQISISDVVSARVATNAMISNKNSKALFNWNSMGPENLGGSTKAIIFDNQDATNNTLLAGSNSGGVWRSTNYGNTWEKVDISETLNVSSLAQAGNGTVYVGTGVSLQPASEELAVGSSIGKGIWMSNGSTFELMPGTAPSGNDLEEEWAFVQKLAVDGSGNIYASTNTGLKYYNGSEWSYAKADGEDLLGKSCDVVAEGGNVLAVVAGNTYLSTGSSTSFQLLSGEDDGMLPLGAFGNVKLAISSSNPDFMYASYVNTSGALFNIYLSENGGNTWRVVYPGGSSLDDIFNGEGLKNNAISVHPTDETTVYIGAFNVYKGYAAQENGFFAWSQVSNGFFPPFPPGGFSRYIHFGINTIVFNPGNPQHIIVGNDGGISITKDDFTTTQFLNRNYNTTEFFTINASFAGDLVGGAHLNSLQFIANNGSNNAIDLFEITNGIPSHFTGGHGHISALNPDFYVGTNVDGTFWRSEDKADNIQTDVTAGISFRNEFIAPFLLWETKQLEYMYDTAQFTAFDRDYLAGEEVYVRSNTYDYPFLYTLEQNVDSATSVQMMDPIGTKAFLAVEGSGSSSNFSGGVYMTLSLLNYRVNPEWWQIGKVEGIPTCMAYSQDANYLWVGTQEGRLFRISNIKRAISKELADVGEPGCIIALTEIELSTTQAITSVSVDPLNPDLIMFTLGNYGNSDYVFVSNNGLDDMPDFISVQSNLPKMPVYSSTFILNNTSAFVGTENGLFYTENIYSSPVEWSYEDAEFGSVPVFALKQQVLNWPSIGFTLNDVYFFFPGAENYGTIYVGTFGNGAYYTNNFVGYNEFPNETSNENKISVFPNPASNQFSIKFEEELKGNCTIELFDLSGKLVANFYKTIPNGERSIEIKDLQIENGSYILRVSMGSKQIQSKLIISK